MSIEAINWVFKQDDLHNSGAKFVLTVLANYADETGRCYPSQATLAAKTSMTDRSVRNHLEWLEEHGYITAMNRQKHNDFTNNLYHLEFTKEKKPSAPMSRKKAVRAENISDEPENTSDGKEFRSENISVEAEQDLGRKTFPNGAENISDNTLALKEYTKEISGGGVSANGNGNNQPAAAAHSPPVNSPNETKSDYLLRKQLEFPQHNVEKIYADFESKCGSAKYPLLKNTRRNFDKWLAEQDEEFQPSASTGYINPATGKGLK